tara:strand:+ start:1018 stop:1191 length:174 start_codon:yes stop_codon:yes gene_type:complete
MMAKMTKTQKRRALNDIVRKSKKIWMQSSTGGSTYLLTFKDIEAIDKIIQRALKRLG